VYLNTIEEEFGGSTHFPKLNLSVQPVRGKAVVFSNVRKDGSPEFMTIHAGMPIKGRNTVKFGMNIWIRDSIG
jgi:prolyl 4-hydroxylase